MQRADLYILRICRRRTPKIDRTLVIDGMHFNKNDYLSVKFHHISPVPNQFRAANAKEILLKSRTVPGHQVCYTTNSYLRFPDCYCGTSLIDTYKIPQCFFFFLAKGSAINLFLCQTNGCHMYFSCSLIWVTANICALWWQHSIKIIRACI